MPVATTTLVTLSSALLLAGTAAARTEQVSRRIVADRAPSELVKCSFEPGPESEPEQFIQDANRRASRDTVNIDPHLANWHFPLPIWGCSLPDMTGPRL